MPTYQRAVCLSVSAVQLLETCPPESYKPRGLTPNSDNLKHFPFTVTVLATLSVSWNSEALQGIALSYY